MTEKYTRFSVYLHHVSVVQIEINYSILLCSTALGCKPHSPQWPERNSQIEKRRRAAWTNKKHETQKTDVIISLKLIFRILVTSISLLGQPKAEGTRVIGLCRWVLCHLSFSAGHLVCIEPHWPTAWGPRSVSWIARGWQVIKSWKGICKI